MITFQLDAMYRKTSLPGSQDGLGSSNALHHECRYMAAQLEATLKESVQVRDRMDKEDEDTFELGQNPIEDPAGQPENDDLEPPHLRSTDYGNFLANMRSLQVSIIDGELRKKPVTEFQHMCNHGSAGGNS